MKMQTVRIDEKKNTSVQNFSDGPLYPKEQVRKEPSEWRNEKVSEVLAGVSFVFRERSVLFLSFALTSSRVPGDYGGGGSSMVTASTDCGCCDIENTFRP